MQLSYKNQKDMALVYTTIYMSLENIIMLSEISKAEKINIAQFYKQNL